MYNGTRVLDVHSHIRPPRAAYLYLTSLLASNYATSSPIGGGRHADQPGMRDEEFKAAADSHAKYLDERNIDVQILSPHPIEIHGWMEPHVFKSWISFTNDMIFKTVQAHPDRWVGCGQLPQRNEEPDSSHCLPELERIASEYAFPAITLSPDITGRGGTPGMDEHYWDPVYERCEELGIVVIVHGTDNMDPRFRSIPRSFQFAFQPEQWISMMLLRHGDQFKRFPGLKVIVCHCGGALDRHIGDYPWLAKEKDVSNNLFYDTCSYDLDFLAAAIKQRGIPQMCFGVEAPGGGSNMRPGTDLTADDMVPMFADHPTLSFLTEQDKVDIMTNNPARVVPGLATPVETNAKAKVAAYEKPAVTA